MVKDGVKRRIMVNKEVIVSAGSINSPQLLMLSGIGPKQHLNQFNVICLSGWVLTMTTKVLISINQNDWPGCLHQWFQYFVCVCNFPFLQTIHVQTVQYIYTTRHYTSILTFSWSDFNILTDLKRMRVMIMLYTTSVVGVTQWNITDLSQGHRALFAYSNTNQTYCIISSQLYNP